jgi:peptidoglycan/xylan/chitin deacetylase (PgdA/CDA1 family)
MSGGTVYLMYHEIERAGRELCERQQGYVRYVVSESVFREHLARLRDNGFRGVSVSEALRLSDEDNRSIAITFDDGCETDFVIAAPLLKELRFNATFYAIAGRVGERGYLSRNQLRQLSDSGFEIGCHSMTHRYLDDLSDQQLRVEIAEAKDRLEQITGKHIAHFSCPGGRVSRAAIRIAREAGYASVATSRIGVNTKATDPFALSRVAVLRGIATAEFDRICRAEGFTARRARTGLLNVAKVILGNSIYERVRASVLDQN